MYALDFGTSNTVVSRWNPATRQPETLNLGPLSQGELIPSLVYVRGVEDMLYGQQVLDQGLDIPGEPRFFRNFKRGIGAPVQGFLPQLDGAAVSYEQVGTWFLEGIFQQLQTQGETLDELVITVPVNSFEAYRQWLSQQVHIQRLHLLDESTAAALGYQELSKTVLVFDFGGGTLDLSLVEPAKAQGFLVNMFKASRPQTARVLAKVGRTLGGSDVDLWLAQALAQQLQLPRSQRLLKLAERLKIALSQTESYTEPFLDDETFTTYELSCTRSQLQQLLTQKGFFQQLDSALSELAQQARSQGYTLAEVPRVLVVGGTSQMPAVQNWLHQNFKAKQLALDKPFTAVAHGALYLNQGINLQDYLYHSYGIRYWDHRQAKHNWQPLFERGTAYPSSSYTLTLGASVTNQPSIELVIGELGGETTEVYFDGTSLVTRPGNTALGQVRPLNEESKTIARLEPLGAPGSDRIRVDFQVDRQRTLRITVTDLLTQRTLAQNQAVIELR